MNPRLSAVSGPSAACALAALLLVLQLATLVRPAPAERAAAAGATAPDVSARPAPIPTGLWPWPAGEAPFDTPGRRKLAQDAFTFFPRQEGLFVGRSVYQLPVAPWLTGDGSREAVQTWQVAVPGSTPLYLLAAAAPDGALDPAATTIAVDGAPLSGLDTYAHAGVEALYAGRQASYAVLDLVFAPPSAGRYQVEVRTAADGGESEDAGATLLVYDVTVLPPDALGPLLLRSAPQSVTPVALAGTLGGTYALLGGERRLVPDDVTARLLGFGAEEAVPVSAGMLSVIPEGPPLPVLREGMLVRAAGDSAVFRLQRDNRVWIGAWPAADDEEDWAGSPRSVPAPVLQTIAPLLVDGQLVRTAGPDLYRVQRQSLRKVPGWEWVEEQGFSTSGVLYAPDRVLRALPDGSPYWVRAGGTGMDRVFYSAALGRPMPYRVYVPPGYAAGAAAGRRYPVLYLLHGFSGRYDEWTGYGAEEVANELLADGTFGPALIVMPQGGLGYWLDEADGGPRWAEYVAHDLVRHVDTTYRTIPRREARAIGGLSMGAHGAVQIALRYPDLFGVVGAHSPSIRSPEESPAFFGAGDEFAQHDPLSLIAASALAQPPAFWIDTGEDDPWRESAEALHRALDAKGWPHEWRVFPGEHNGWYWGEHLWEYLPYYGVALEQSEVAAPTPSPDP